VDLAEGCSEVGGQGVGCADGVLPRSRLQLLQLRIVTGRAEARRRSCRQPGLQGGQEIRPVRCLDQLPRKGLERDVLTGAEPAQQVRYPSCGQAGSDPGEQVGGDQADLLGDEAL